MCLLRVRTCGDACFTLTQRNDSAMHVVYAIRKHGRIRFERAQQACQIRMRRRNGKLRDNRIVMRANARAGTGSVRHRVSQCVRVDAGVRTGRTQTSIKTGK